MLRAFQIVLLFAIAFFGATRHAYSQDGVKPPKENATRAELEKWLTHALSKYASYNTRSTSVSVAGVKMTGCKLSFSVIRRSNPVNNDTVNAVLKTKGVKHDEELDIARIEPNGVEIADYLLPEFQTITIRERYGSGNSPSPEASRTVEIVVKHDAAESIKNVLERMLHSCVAGS